MRNIKLAIILFLKLILYINNEIRIPFKTHLTSISSGEISEYLKSLIQNDIFIELEVGTPNKQKIASFLKFEEFPFYISGNQVSSSIYNQNNSDSFKCDPSEYIFLEGKEKFRTGYIANETFEINLNNNNKLIAKELSFILATKVTTNSPSNIGLMIKNQYTSIPEISFINQLKELKLIDYYSFVLNYTSENEGEFVIGGAPHIYNKKYNQNNYYTEYAKSKLENFVYGLDFLSINYGDNQTNIGGKMESKFLCDFGLIIGTHTYRDLILDKFFNEKINNNLCFRQKINATIEWREGEKQLEYFYCNKNVNISELENLKFISQNLNYTFNFNNKELFEEFKEYYLFKILFFEKTQYYWIFGNIWLKKYLMVFDQDEKKIGFYNNINNNIINDSSSNLGLKIIVILCIILVIILGVMIFVYCKNDRHIRINELEDNYEYNAVQ